MHVREIPGIYELSTQEKIQLVGELWDSIAADGSELPVPESHKRELEKRLRAHEADPTNTLSLEEIRKRLENGK